MDVSARICELRKSRNMTQAQLAAVGVSAQVVSKWESGGMPDIELLPKIAERLGVSIDALFGREQFCCGELEAALAQDLAVTPRAQRFAKAFDYCWALEKGLAGDADAADTVAEISAEAERGYSQTLWDEGFATLSFAAELPYFLLMPEPASGWGRRLKQPDIMLAPSRFWATLMS
jgi:transcriptional regulator with XRE-family HTH domain